ECQRRGAGMPNRRTVSGQGIGEGVRFFELSGRFHQTATPRQLRRLVIQLPRASPSAESILIRRLCLKAGVLFWFPGKPLRLFLRDRMVTLEVRDLHEALMQPGGVEVLQLCALQYRLGFVQPSE